MVNNRYIVYLCLISISIIAFYCGQKFGQRQKTGLVFVDDIDKIPTGKCIVVQTTAEEGTTYIKGLSDGILHGLFCCYQDGVLQELSVYQDGKKICGLTKVTHPWNGKQSCHWEYVAADGKEYIMEYTNDDLPAYTVAILLEHALTPKSLCGYVERLFLIVTQRTEHRQGENR